MSEPLQGHNNDMTSVLQTATGASYATSIGTVLAGGLSLNEWLAVLGAVLAVLTYLTNLWFRLEERRQRDELHVLKKQQLINGNAIEDDS